MSQRESTTIHLGEQPRGKIAAMKAYASSASSQGGGKGFGITDFILRLCCLAVVLAATISMGTSNQDLTLFNQFFQFKAGYDDFDAFTSFVVSNGIVCAYLLLSLPFSIVTIVRPQATGIRLLLLILDSVATALTSASAGAAAAVVFLAHQGNARTNWAGICNQFGDFCRSISGAVVASFIAVVLFILLLIVSGLALRRN